MRIASALLNVLPLHLRHGVRRLYRSLKRASVLARWERRGRPVPPPHYVKQLLIEGLQKRTRYDVFVETGTYLGDMVHAQLKNFKRIYSIELSLELWRDASRRFRSCDHVRILHGDSGKVLNTITSQLSRPAIFWLDGHYSGGVTALGSMQCPIYAEIDAIFEGKRLKHIILVDDARCFTGENDYPQVDELIRYVQSKDRSYGARIKDDILRFVPSDLEVLIHQ